MAIGYATGLCLIAGFTLITNYLADHSLARQQRSAHIVNVSGRQRMLSQRIVSLCLQLSTATHQPRMPSSPENANAGTQAIRRDLASAIRLMRASSVALIVGSASMRLPPSQDAVILGIYNLPPHQLKSRIQTFLSQAEKLSAQSDNAMSPQDATLQKLEIAAHGPLLDALQASVDRYQQLSEHLVGSLHDLLVVLTWLMMCVLAIEAYFIYRPTLKALADSQRALRLAAITDPLTGCLNRRWFMDNASVECTLAAKSRTPLTMILLDIDHFKQVNDTYGHPAGDQVLIGLVAAILKIVRVNDRLARIGGEEFAILLPHTEEEAALQLAQRLLHDVSAQPFTVFDKILRITVSIGVGTFNPLDVSFDSLLNRTDTHLYEAKHAGRNRVCGAMLASPVPGSAVPLRKSPASPANDHQC